MKQNRIRSKVVWAAAFAQLLMVIGLFMPQISNEVKVVGTAIIEIATLFGVLNDPTSKDTF